MKQYSVLIVDDNEADRYLLKRSLRKTGLISDIVEQTNGESALEFLSQPDENNDLDSEFFPPEIVFLDINMPLMNGFEFLESFNELRKTSRYKSIVVLMISSSARQEDIKLATSYNFVKQFLVKGQNSTEEFSELLRTTFPL